MGSARPSRCWKLDRRVVRRELTKIRWTLVIIHVFIWLSWTFLEKRDLRDVEIQWSELCRPRRELYSEYFLLKAASIQPSTGSFKFAHSPSTQVEGDMMTLLSRGDMGKDALLNFLLAQMTQTVDQVTAWRGKSGSKPADSMMKFRSQSQNRRKTASRQQIYIATKKTFND